MKEVKLVDHDIVTVNAIIKSTGLGIIDGTMVFTLTLQYENQQQIVCEAVSVITILERILKIAEVNHWEELPGRVIRSFHSNLKVYSIGHIVKNEWLDFDEFFESLKANKNE